jgi:hypothetical protein
MNTEPRDFDEQQFAKGLTGLTYTRIQRKVQ